MKKEFNNSIIFLRFIAIFVVVLGHSIIIYDYNWGLYATARHSYIFYFIKQIINIIQMPLWFSISGYLFYYTMSKKDLSKFKLFTDKLKRLMLPFLIIGIFYMLPIRMFAKYQNFLSNTIFYNIVHNIILGFDCGHLWYLPTLFFIFIMFSFYKPNCSFKTDFFLLVMLFLISGFNSYFKYTYLINISSFAIIFFIGLLINKYKLKTNIGINYIIPLVLSLIVFSNINISNNIIYSFLYKSIQILFIVIIFRMDFSKFGKVKMINSISNKSYGIYLLHSPLIYISFCYYPNISPIIMLFINFIFFGGLCYFGSLILEKSRLKFIVGK